MAGITLTRIALLLALSVATLHGQQPAPAPAAAPADEWRQFRGTPRLTGNSSTTLPATLKVLWTYDVGDLIDSSAAIANGVVYVGGGNGDLIALDLASGKLRWKYDDRQPDWRVIARGGNRCGLHRRSRRPGARGQHRRRQAAVDLPHRVRDQVVAGRRRRCRARRLVRRQPLRVRAGDGQAEMEGPDQRDGARDAGGPERPGVHRRLRLDAAGDPHRRRQGGLHGSTPAPTPARRRSSTARGPTSAPSTTRCWRSISSAAGCSGATPIPNAGFRSIRRRRSPTDASSSADATSRSMRST